MSFLKSLYSFEGRVSRKYYWLFFVGFALYAVVAGALSLGSGYAYLKFFYTPQFNHAGQELNSRTESLALFLPFGALMLAGCIAALCTMVKRMHDRNHSARWVAIWIVLALVTILVRSLLDEPFRRSFFWDWWYVGTRYGWDLLVYGATMVLGGLPAIVNFALKTYRNLTGWPVTQSIFALPVLIPLALYGLWYFWEAGPAPRHRRTQQIRARSAAVQVTKNGYAPSKPFSTREGNCVMLNTSPLPRDCCTILLTLVEDDAGRSRIAYASDGGTLDDERAHVRAVKELCAAAADDQLCEIEAGFGAAMGCFDTRSRR